MPLTVSNTTGDGIADNLISTRVTLPDSGTSIAFDGTVMLIGGTLVTLTGSPVSSPAPPGSGTIFWNMQADPYNGAVTVQQSTSADPTPIASSGANPCLVFFRQSLVSGNTDPALVPTDSTPDSW